MPVYDFKCPKCGETRTQTLSIHATNHTATCKCGSEMVKIIPVPAVTFRGTGWGKDN